MTQSDNARTTAGLGDSFVDNRGPLSLALVQEELRIDLGDQGSRRLRFEQDVVTVDDGVRTRVSPYQALEPDNGLFLVAVDGATPQTSTEYVLDRTSGRVLVLDQKVTATGPLEPSVQQRCIPATLADAGPPGFPRDRGLIGIRALWTYSDDDVYEHLYLNEHRYVWHCVRGVEAPQADTESCQLYRLRADVHLLVFTEKVMTMGAAMVLNFVSMRSACSALGIEQDGDAPSHFTFGAHGEVLSRTSYPARFSVTR